MSVFSEYWSKIIVINLARRADRWEHFKGEMAKIGVGPGDYERFDAHDRPIGDDKGSGNFGCTASHRGVLELVCHNQWSRTLVLEDDAEVIDPRNFNSLWEHFEDKIPSDWDMLYLGGHYGSAPLARVNPNILRVDTMLTTSSYAITHKAARELAPHVYGVGPIDSIFGSTGAQGGVPHSGFLARHKTYCLQPRLFCQYTNYSDLQDREMNNRMCMTDRHHESLMAYGYVGDYKDYVPPPPRFSSGKIMNPSQHQHNPIKTDSAHPFPTLPNL
jgi:hypothetical protein